MKQTKLVFELFRDAEDVWHEEDGEGRTRAEFYIKKPDRKVEQEANIQYNKELRRLLDKKSECLLRQEVSEILKSRGIWDASRDSELKKAEKLVSDAVSKLSRGAMKKSEGYKIALDIIKQRNEVARLNMVRGSLDNQTAESKADEIKLNYYIYRCTYVNSELGSLKPGHLYFGDMDFETFLESEDSMVGFAGAKLLNFLFDVETSRKQQPEWKFLMKHGFADDKLRLKDVTKSYFVTLDGRRIDEKGNYLSETGEKVDEFGNPVVDMDNVEFSD